MAGAARPDPAHRGARTRRHLRARDNRSGRHRVTAVLSRYLDVADATEELARDVAAGLTRTPKELPPKWLYDARGSQLFEDITRLPEYYPTRAEREILADRAGEIASVTQAETLIELGAGSCEKARVLLDALTSEGGCSSYV